MGKGFSAKFQGLDSTSLEVVVRVTPDEGEAFNVLAAPFFWGQKTLMKVNLWEKGETIEDGNGILTFGMKVSVGNLAKKAIKEAGLTLPVAPPSKRGKAKEEPAPQA